MTSLARKALTGMGQGKSQDQTWSTLERGRASRNLPKELRFDLKGTVPPVTWVGPGDKKAARRLLEEVEDAKWVAVDTEYEMATQDMIMWSLSDGKVRAAIHVEALPYFKAWLEAKSPRKIMHNAMADLPVFQRQGVNVSLGADTMVMDFYTDENRDKRLGGRGHGLKACAWEWLGLEMADFDEVFGKKKKGAPFPELRGLMLENLEVSTEYASLDAYATYWIYALQRKILTATTTHKGKSLWDVYRKHEVPFLISLYEVEHAGVAVDPKVLDEIGVDLEKTVLRSRWVMQYLLPETIRVDRVKDKKPFIEIIHRDKIKTTSSQQMAAIFYDVLKRKSIYEDEPRTTKEECLAAWAEQGCVLSDIMLSLRRAQKMRKDFVGYRKGDPKAAKNQEKPKEGEDHKGILHFLDQAYPGAPYVVRTHINPIGTVTGRISASEPNLMQIPSKTDKDPYRMRRAFVARPGCVLVVADYSMAELRVLAHLSSDPVMMRVLREGADIHSQTAKAAFALKCEPEEVKERYPDLRGKAKVINFGIAYGMSGKALARKLQVSDKQADKFIDAFFRQYRGVHRWIKDTKALAHRQGYVETLLGRRRRLPNLFLEDDYSKVGAAERQAINAPIQGGVGDIMRVAMTQIRTDPDLCSRDTKTLLQVHDELIIECAELDSWQVKERVKILMEGAFKLRVPLVADVAIGPNWEDAKQGK